MPLTTTTGMFVLGSLPAGTWRNPVLFSPETAIAVPTESFDVCADSVIDNEITTAKQPRINVTPSCTLAKSLDQFPFSIFRIALFLPHRAGWNPTLKSMKVKPGGSVWKSRGLRDKLRIGAGNGESVCL